MSKEARGIKVFCDRASVPNDSEIRKKMYKMCSFRNISYICLFASMSLSLISGFLLPGENDCPSEAFMNISESNFTENWRENANTNTTSVCGCLKKACLPMCCPIGTRFAGNDKCLPLKDGDKVKFPALHDPDSLNLLKEEIRVEDFHVFTWDPCHGGEKYNLQPNLTPDDEFKFLANGSIFLTNLETLLDFKRFCFAAIGDLTYNVVLCFDDTADYDLAATENETNVAFPVGMILSVPFLFLTFLVYSLIPELKNMHGCTLRGYIGSLIIAYTVLACVQITPQEKISDTACILMGTHDIYHRKFNILDPPSFS